MKVLIADDEPNIVISLEFMMKREGFEVVVARVVGATACAGGPARTAFRVRGQRSARRRLCRRRDGCDSCARR